MSFTIKRHRLVGDNITNVSTNKMRSGTMKPLAIVMHYTAGWSHKGSVSTLSKAVSKGGRKASAHLDAARDGGITQIVPFNRKAWHAGPSRWNGLKDFNGMSVGIEQDNIGPLTKNGSYWKDGYGNRVMDDGSVMAWSKRRKKWFETMKLETGPPDWLNEKHPVHGNKNLWWEPYPEELLDSSYEAVKAILKQYPSIKYIVAHEEIDTRGWKSDPGPAFPMKKFTDLLNVNTDREDNTEDGFDEKQKWVVNTPDLNVRGGPSVRFPVLEIFPKWRQLWVHQRIGKWLMVSWWDEEKKMMREGWAHSAFMDRKTDEV